MDTIHAQVLWQVIFAVMIKNPVFRKVREPNPRDVAQRYPHGKTGQ